MGVIKFFSANSRDDECLSSSKYVKIVKIKSTPDPTKFTILKEIIVNDYPVLFINYLGVQNYEGNKILMYPKCFDINYLKSNNRIDPHFFTKGDSPIARFEPTEYGWKLAKTLAKAL